MNEISITELGNPAKPHGEAGEIMLKRMGESHRNVTDWALLHLDIDGSEWVLDIGCGAGDALKKMSAQITDGKLFGVDYSEVAVDLSKKNNISDIETGKMEIVQADVANLPFNDDVFDVIYTIESFYFWGNNPGCLKEVHRVLAPDGVFMIIADIHGGADLTDEEKENVKKYNLFNPTWKEYVNLLKTAGFSNVTVRNNLFNTKWICVEGKK